MTLLEATTLARVKAHLKITDTTDDTRLGELIQGVSDEIEKYLDSKLMQESQTEELDVRQNQRVWYLRSRINAVTSVKTRTDWDWASASALDSDLYHFVDQEHQLYISSGPLIGRRTLQVVYTGGFATSTANLVANFPAIATAADYQVVQEWRRKENLAAVSRSSRGGNKSWGDEHQMLERVRQMLDPYRRLVT